MTTRYTGMNPDGTGNLNDMEHLKQSVRDILTTPLASRVMRREYGSLVPDLIDEPMNNTTRLQCMSAAVIALTRWEPPHCPGRYRRCLEGRRPRRGDAVGHCHADHAEC
ncbi:Baseplate assembly protein W [Escherichia coli]|uniref:Baseplate assembly protein W n=1 Tax=Escherichia coli TaxID=562 RepID=A0A376J3V4_ECOLX|nr:Baseplate assembly protein W [Escherichia coli]